MRKTFLAIWAYLYLMLAVGFSVDWHYCMGKLSEIRFHDETTDICGRCGMQEKKGGCCENETKFYKYQHAYKAVKDQLDNPVHLVVEADQHNLTTLRFSKWVVVLKPFQFPPEPPPPSLARHKQLRVYRI
jgi:hypothetical protein